MFGTRCSAYRRQSSILISKARFQQLTQVGRRQKVNNLTTYHPLSLAHRVVCSTFTAWLRDKRTGSKFALPALYRPYSLIPLEIWKASPSSTNGNEQSHRNINRDGVNLTLLGAIMKGMQYDARTIASMELLEAHGIYARDQEATHFRRYERALNRQGEQNETSCLNNVFQ